MIKAPSHPGATPRTTCARIPACPAKPASPTGCLCRRTSAQPATDSRTISRLPISAPACCRLHSETPATFRRSVVCSAVQAPNAQRMHPFPGRTCGGHSCVAEVFVAQRPGNATIGPGQRILAAAPHPALLQICERQWLMPSDPVRWRWRLDPRSHRGLRRRRRRDLRQPRRQAHDDPPRRAGRRRVPWAGPGAGGPVEDGTPRGVVLSAEMPKARPWTGKPQMRQPQERISRSSSPEQLTLTHVHAVPRQIRRT